MKIAIILLTLIFISCNPQEQSHCSLTFLEKDGFMLHGGILDAYDNGRVFISIVRINNPYDWKYNEYFTGAGFSKDEREEKKVLDKDSCELKDLYFTYLKNNPAK